MPKDRRLKNICQGGTPIFSPYSRIWFVIQTIGTTESRPERTARGKGGAQPLPIETGNRPTHPNPVCRFQWGRGRREEGDGRGLKSRQAEQKGEGRELQTFLCRGGRRTNGRRRRRTRTPLHNGEEKGEWQTLQNTNCFRPMQEHKTTTNHLETFAQPSAIRFTIGNPTDRHDQGGTPGTIPG